MKKNVIIIAGPTASGKSQMAIDVAKKIGGEIINTDSQQLYKDTPIISACPSEDDKKIVPHHLYQIYESNKHGTVVDWLNLCVEKINEIWKKGKTPVVVGGSGMYINNLLYGTTPIPAILEDVKSKAAEIKDKYNALDEKAQESLNANDISRVTRALEVFLQTGESIVDWHNKPLIKAINANFFVIKILPQKKDLELRINNRFDKMIAMGALEEAKHFKGLEIMPNMPAAKALGLPELIDFIDGKTSIAEAIELSKIHSHQYAKRQITWFKNKLEANYLLEECYVQLSPELEEKLIKLS